MNIDINNTVGEIVAEDYRKAAVFKSFDIDFCCGGGQTVKQACERKNVDVDELTSLLLEAEKKSEIEIDYNSWSLTDLIAHIIAKHHTYVKESIPVISQFVNKVKQVHGNNKPNVSDIADHFQSLAMELNQHLMKEESILFPYIEELEQLKAKNQKLSASQFGSIENPINMMLLEHTHAGNEIEIISDLTNKYQPPVGACATHTVSYGQLKDFETDLLQHIHLENNILFPKAIALEKELL